jgi:hypothetical protein
LLALKNDSNYSRSIQEAASWLGEFGLPPPQANETDETIRKQFNIDTNLSGWPWQSGEASWIEPTALILLALDSLEIFLQDREKIIEAVRYLDDRRCRGGGWNFGNPVMFNKDIPPRTYHTALCILVLSQIAPEYVLEEDLSTLIGLLDDDERPLGNAMSILALKSINQDTSLYEKKLAAMQDPSGSWEGNTYFSAMSLLALSPNPQLIHR